MMPTLYITEISPPVRAVLMTAKLLNLTFNIVEIDLKKKEHLSPKFLKLNPQHTVPTLVDNGFVIWDSHAIIAYLVGKYGKDDTLYPKDVLRRAVIDQRLHFDSEIISYFTRNILNPMIYDDQKSFPEDVKDRIIEAYNLLEIFLEDDWIAGNFLSIADLSLVASITSLNLLFPITPEKYPKIVKWIKKIEKEQFYLANENGLNKLRCLLCSEIISTQ